MPEVYDVSTIPGLEAYKRMPNARHIRMMMDIILCLSGFCILTVTGNTFNMKPKSKGFCIADTGLIGLIDIDAPEFGFLFALLMINTAV
jgi:hypothetical protein